MAELIVTNLTARSDAGPLISDASLKVASGDLVAVVGENGSGKTCMLKAIVGFIASTGSRTVDGHNLAQMPAKHRALAIGWQPQTAHSFLPIPVRDAVAMGRFAHGMGPRRLTEADQVAIEHAIKDCALQPIIHRSTGNLSGGELARVHLARTFANASPILLVDEPTAALDVRHSLAIMQILRKKCDQGLGALVVLHDINLAARFADRIIILKGGKIMEQGPVDDTITPDVIAAAFGIRANISYASGRPQIENAEIASIGSFRQNSA